ncbi:hypothetical protein HBI56_028790 [Parastagonospora nodorum]|uniref:Uncharacterized protein n=1 Tax=Phaeosphaeria nodorum (strain SN15 / ATCC MYA-4574 / FGSC 10173) TaxID=321614 RepID=A0A7U2HY92_PHANO|nr:hypothetical protein HBH56_016400 [Parastagonospora nodorum]QRC95098.1 hypothetical protein JI435_028270 [Parastagonospora nodorum SN15]KAH3937484.1 hypothetical protein HBH54_018060 [Parastagonospora nodorum]KAH3953591.1 hypothetical protein HBH53_030440 [Parastagonospora nodorum]KAH3969290.1 hypothetical protein HBH51_122590 [Parastagonospora nodorum]
MGSSCLLSQEELIDKIRPKHMRFFNEPCEHIPDHSFVHMMWEASEDERTTDGEEENQRPDEPSSRDRDDGDSGAECEDQEEPIFRLIDYPKVEEDADGSETKEVLDDPSANNWASRMRSRLRERA